MPGTRRPSLEQLITTHQSTLETIIKTPKRQQGADSEEAKAGINAIYELIGKDEPLTQDKVGAFVQQLGIVLPPAQLDTLFAFFASRRPISDKRTGRKASPWPWTSSDVRAVVRDLVDCEGVADSSTEIHGRGVKQLGCSTVWTMMVLASSTMMN